MCLRFDEPDTQTKTQNFGSMASNAADAALSLFGSDSDSDSDTVFKSSEGSSRAGSSTVSGSGGALSARHVPRKTHPVIRSLVCGLLRRSLSTTCADLRSYANACSNNNRTDDSTPFDSNPLSDNYTAKKNDANVAEESLQAASALALQDEWSGVEIYDNAKNVELQAWKVLTENKTWPHVCWRESFIMSLVMLIGYHYALMEDETEVHITHAFECLDKAFIMGGPGSMLKAIGRILEPKLKARLFLEGMSHESQFLWRATAEELRHMHGWYASAKKIKTITLPLDVAAFRRDFFKSQLPVVIRDGTITDGWLALGKWCDLKYLVQNFGHRLVPIEIGRHHEKAQRGKNRDNMSAQDSKPTLWQERICTLRDFIQQYILPSNVIAHERSRRWKENGLERHGQDANSPPPLPASKLVGYLAQHTLFEQLPSLKKDFESPHDLCAACNGGQGVEKINAWFGTEGTVTPLHFDSYDNLLVQVAGYKYVRLYSPDQTKFLYVNSERNIDMGETRDRAFSQDVTMAQNNISPIDVEAPSEENLRDYPLFGSSQFTEAILSPGDCLFIPEGTWHYVRSLSPSFSLNFWF